MENRLRWFVDWHDRRGNLDAPPEPF